MGQNLELVRAVFDEWNRGETASHEYFHPELEWMPLRAATEGAYRGISGVDKFVADTREVFDTFELRCELLEVGQQVLAWGVIHVRTAGSGIETDIPTGGVFDFRDGKIVRWEDFGSEDKAREALRPNTEVFREALDAFNRRDKTAFLALCDPDIENFAPREWPESDSVRGSEAVWDFFVENNEPWENSPLEAVEVVDAGNDTVVAHLKGQMHGRVSGADVPWAFWQVVVYRGGKAVRFSWFGDRAEAFEVAGVEA